MSQDKTKAERFVAMCKKRGDRPNWDLVETAFSVGQDHPLESQAETSEMLTDDEIEAWIALGPQNDDELYLRGLRHGATWARDKCVQEARTGGPALDDVIGTTPSGFVLKKPLCTCGHLPSDHGHERIGCRLCSCERLAIA